MLLFFSTDGDIFQFSIIFPYFLSKSFERYFVNLKIKIRKAGSGYKKTTGKNGQKYARYPHTYAKIYGICWTIHYFLPLSWRKVQPWNGM
jgi:hypothetical protein